MPRLTKEETQIKLDVLKNAFEALKEESKGSPKNKATFDNVIALANENERITGKKPIGRSTLLQPRGEGFIALKHALEAFKVEHKKSRNLIPEKSKDKITNLEEQRNGLIIELASYHEDIHELKQRLENKELQLRRIEKERDKFAEIIAELRVKYE